MKYLSGEEIEVGDNVLIENRRTPGVVECVIETDQDMKEWNLDERGVLLKSLHDALPISTIRLCLLAHRGKG